MLFFKILTIVFCLEVLSFYIGGVYTYYMVFYTMFISVVLLAFSVFNRRFKRDTKIPLNLKGFKYKKEIQFYLTIPPAPAVYITYGAKGIKIFIRKKLHKMLTQKELEVILHHELGHYHYRYLSLLGNTVILVVIITLPVVMHSLYMVIDSLLITYSIFIVYSFLSLLFYSNFRKILEILADRQSKKYTSKQRFTKVLIKTAKVFDKEKSSSRVYNLFFELHPSVKRRCSISCR